MGMEYSFSSFLLANICVISKADLLLEKQSSSRRDWATQQGAFGIVMIVILQVKAWGEVQVRGAEFIGFALGRYFFKHERFRLGKVGNVGNMGYLFQAQLIGMIG